jgi:hypothetical protein
MQVPLVIHPDCAPSPVTDIVVDIGGLGATSLTLGFQVKCPPGTIALGEPNSGERRDGLWRTTCFEAFIAEDEAPGYCEFNFAPSSDWAAYQFDTYREGMRDLATGLAPSIEFEQTKDGFDVWVWLELPEFGINSSRLRLGLTAVIAAASGELSYWSVRHGSDRPDFHHPDCLAIDLVRAETK